MVAAFSLRLKNIENEMAVRDQSQCFLDRESVGKKKNLLFLVDAHSQKLYYISQTTINVSNLLHITKQSCIM